MKLHDYLKDKGSVLLVNAAGLFFLSLFLRLSAVRTGDILIICIFWFLILTIWLAADFYRSRKHFLSSFYVAGGAGPKLPHLRSDGSLASPDGPALS